MSLMILHSSVDPYVVTRGLDRRRQAPVEKPFFVSVIAWLDSVVVATLDNVSLLQYSKTCCNSVMKVTW